MACSANDRTTLAVKIAVEFVNYVKVKFTHFLPQAQNFNFNANVNFKEGYSRTLNFVNKWMEYRLECIAKGAFIGSYIKQTLLYSIKFLFICI